MSVSNDNKRPVDIVMDADGCLRALYADGSLGPALSQPVSVRVWKQPRPARRVVVCGASGSPSPPVPRRARSAAGGLPVSGDASGSTSQCPLRSESDRSAAFRKASLCAINGH